MTPEEIAKLDAEYAESMRLQAVGDPETDHRAADLVLFMLVTELGFTRTANEYTKIRKWYS